MSQNFTVMVSKMKVQGQKTVRRDGGGDAERPPPAGSLFRVKYFQYHKLKFLIPIFLQSDGENLWYFKIFDLAESLV